MLEMVGIWFVCAWGSSSLKKSVAVKENEDSVVEERISETYSRLSEKEMKLQQMSSRQDE